MATRITGGTTQSIHRGGAGSSSGSVLKSRQLVSPNCPPMELLASSTLTSRFCYVVAMIGSTAFTTIATFGEPVRHGEFAENDERAGRGNEGPRGLARWLVHGGEQSSWGGECQGSGQMKSICN